MANFRLECGCERLGRSDFYHLATRAAQFWKAVTSSKPIYVKLRTLVYPMQTLTRLSATKAKSEFLQTQRRSKLEAAIDVLAAVESGIQKPTHLMYRANLSWASLQENVNALMRSGLIREASLAGHKRYEVTDKGERVLRNYTKIVNEVLLS